MRSHSPFIVDVRELLENPGTRRDVRIQAPLEGAGDGFVEIAGDVIADLVLEAIEGGLLAQGNLRGEIATACSRCLQPMTQAFDCRGSELYRPPSEVWEEEYVIKDLKVDLERMVRDTVVVDLPLRPLCRPDCAGLCPQCGIDRNEATCTCDAPSDLRWSALKDLDLSGDAGSPA